MIYAPIAFFAYKRPEHTLKSLQSLSENPEASQSELFIFCDAPKQLEDWSAVNKVREVIRQEQWCKVVHIREQDNNLGLANSIITGVTELCDRFGRVIVIEDDLILSPYFLQYINSALDRYADEPRVMQISGYMFPIELKPETDSIFLPFTTSWGWATWKRAWKFFDFEMLGYEIIKNDRKLRHKFDLSSSYPYFSMLETQRNGQLDSWAIRWYLSVFMKEGLTLYPVRSLVHNIGFDGSGTHCGASLSLDGEMTQSKILSMPKSLRLNYKEIELVFKYLRSLNQPPSLLQRIKNKIMRIF